MERVRYSMDRDWAFYLGEITVLPDNKSHESMYCFSKAGGASGVAAQAFDDGHWQRVDLPHDWQHELDMVEEAALDQGYREGGISCYRKKFALCPDDAFSALSLVFDGVQGVCDVYLNGSKLHHSESGYSSFRVNIGDICEYDGSPNILTVIVDGTAWEGWWYEGFGINRHVWLDKTPKTHIAWNGVWINPEKKGSCWDADTEITIENERRGNTPFSLSLTVFDRSGAAVCSVRRRGSVDGYDSITIKANLHIDKPHIWTLCDPSLYTLVARVTVGGDTDEVKTRFGLRTLRFDANKGFFLNDEPTKLYGTCNHHDHAGVGSAVPDDVLRYRLLRLKAMGCNAYRCSHNNPAPEMLDMCDELGILVMDENRWFGTSEYHLGLLRGMVLRDRNHPCVIMWSAFNEEPWQGTDKGRRLAMRQYAEIKRLDPSRPVLGAFNNGLFERGGAAPVFDILGVNYAVFNFDKLHEMYPDMPIVSSETVSAFSTRDQDIDEIDKHHFANFDEHAADWGETAQEACEAVLTRDFVMGLFVWTGFDYRGEPTPYEWPSVSSHFGVMDTCGYAKDTFYLYRAYYTKEPIIHLFPHWNGRKGETRRMAVYTNCDEAELFINGVSVGRKPVPRFNQPSWDLTYEDGIIEAVGYIDGREAARDRRETTGPACALLLKPVQSAAHPDTRCAVIIDITAVDGDGRHVPTFENEVSVTVLGGRLLGMGNGDPTDHTPDLSETHALFHGRLQAIVAPDRDAKAITFTARAKGLGEVAVILPVIERGSAPEIESVRRTVITGFRMSGASASRPDPMTRYEKNDMNSLEAVSFAGEPQPQLEGRSGEYCLYRADLPLGKPRADRSLVLCNVLGSIEAYIDGKPCEIIESEGVYTICIDESAQGLAEMTVILKNDTPDGRAGILSPVELLG